MGQDYIEETNSKPTKGTWVWIVSGLAIAIVAMAKVIHEDSKSQIKGLKTEILRKDSLISVKNAELKDCNINVISTVKKQIEDIRSIDDALTRKSQMIDKEIVETEKKIKQYN